MFVRYGLEFVKELFDPGLVAASGLFPALDGQCLAFEWSPLRQEPEAPLNNATLDSRLVIDSPFASLSKRVR